MGGTQWRKTQAQYSRSLATQILRRNCAPAPLEGAPPDALLATKLTAIESAAAVGALSQREAAARCATLRAEHERAYAHTLPTDEASILANAERLRAALVSAATDALRDALRRTLGTVRCRPTVEGECRYLLATFEGGDAALLEWLALGDAANQPGLSALVAGAGCGTFLRSRGRCG